MEEREFNFEVTNSLPLPLWFPKLSIFRGEEQSVTLTRQSNRLKSDAKYPWIPKQYILMSISTVNMAKNNLFAISERKKRSNPMKNATYREENKACE